MGGELVDFARLVGLLAKTPHRYTTDSHKCDSPISKLHRNDYVQRPRLIRGIGRRGNLA